LFNEQLSSRWIEIFLGSFLVVWAFDESAVLERRTGSDERDQVGCVHSAPA
jgi:hypothetical protein